MRILLLNQCFWPDVVATGQQLTMLAKRLTARGHEVTVIASRRGYDNGEKTFPKRENWQGIKIHRISSLNLGKTSRWRRAFNFSSFLVTCTVRLLLTPGQDVVVALTSPPLISWLGSLFVRVKGGELVFWSMDLNPDEAIAAGWLNEKSLTARFLSRLLVSSMRRARAIVALDRFMKQRIEAKGISAGKVKVIAPACDDGVIYDQKGREAFRQQHDLNGKFVVMYAGNHSPCHPLDTLMAAANELRELNHIVFLFVGGGSEFERVKEFARAQGLTNIKCLGYQPLDKLSATLSAADLQVVVMGDAFRGIVHPSKIYNILSVGAPFLFIGPPESHVGDLSAKIGSEQLALHALHGETTRVTRLISEAAKKGRGEFGFPAVDLEQFSGDAVYARFIDAIEAAAVPPDLITQVDTAARGLAQQVTYPFAKRTNSVAGGNATGSKP